MHSHSTATPPTGSDPSGVGSYLSTRETPDPPARIARSATLRREWRELDPADRALVTDAALSRWAGDLADDDFSLADVADRERRRNTNIKTFRQGAELTDMQWKLWRFLGRHEGRVCTRLEIARHLWQTPDYPIRPWMLRPDPETKKAAPLADAIKSLVWALRRKLEIDPLRPQHLAAVRSVGYVWYDDPPSTDDGIDYQARSSRFTRLREQYLGLVYGPALPDPGAETAGPYVDVDVVDAVSHDAAGRPYESSVRPGPEYDRITERRATRRGVAPDPDTGP